ncbi:hypothetical protein N7G274_007505 [Stereocaulon virgatum]|uniref:Uncharacterized protein n=1 Tax=Stereocaulon virgatum TaxID=373712 RepID=A0ABR4A3W1_9LECA
MARTSEKSPDSLPPYSESISSTPTSPGSLPQNLANARTTLISSLITTHILPHLHTTALSGLSSSTLCLIPSNISSLHPPSSNASKDPSSPPRSFPGETIVNFPSAENVSLIRLHDPSNTLQFWRQHGVIAELEEHLRSHLRAEGYRVKGDETASAKTNGAKAGKFGGNKRPSGAEWKTAVVEKLEQGEVRAAVAVADVCLRVENEMGLFETRTGLGVVVKVDVGG